MTLLGLRNPLRRISNAARLLARRPRTAATGHRCFVIGHRGAARLEAENTIPSFEKALELGADGIETDVCVTLDGHFVLWHDSHPDDKIALLRQAAGEKTYRYQPDVPNIGSKWRRPVGELTLDELRAHYGYVPRKGTGKRVRFALLDDFFEWSKTEPRLHLVCLDVKLGEHETAGARELAGRIREGRRSGRIREGLSVALLCPQEETLRAILTEARREPLGKDVWIFADLELPGALAVAKRFGVECVSFGLRRRVWAVLRREIAQVLAARKRERIDKVLVWTVSEEKRLRELVGLGVDGIITDDAALLRRIAGGA
ncbi:MAG TPA: glycerophosphodiester phosphodiesterase family protein [Thermoanaerobaculia bacterium]